MSYSFTQITMSQEEYQARLTQITDDTLRYLERQGHISEEDCEDLCTTMVVVPVANNNLFGKLREWLFGTEKEDKTVSKYIVTQIL